MRRHPWLSPCLTRLLTAAVLLASACRRAAAPADSGAAATGEAGGAAAFRDTAAVRRLCALPDSVLAGRGPCVLRDQSEPPAQPPAPPE